MKSRKEQIVKEAENLNNSIAGSGFIKGAKWADANPENKFKLFKITGSVVEVDVVKIHKDFEKLQSDLAVAIKALEAHHKMWCHGNGDCSSECSTTCKALAKIKGEEK